MNKLAFIAIVSMILAVPAFAAPSNFSTEVKAAVDYTLTVTSTIGTQSVLDTTKNSTEIGKLTLVSNLNGFKLTVTSANTGKMIRQNGTEQYPYTLTVASSTLGTLATAYSLSTAYTYTATGAQPASELTFTLNYLKPTEFSPTLSAGVYVDTLTVSIESN
jgi:hypothetical protein